jgi:hypothetical protein
MDDNTISHADACNQREKKIHRIDRARINCHRRTEENLGLRVGSVGKMGWMEIYQTGISTGQLGGVSYYDGRQQGQLTTAPALSEGIFPFNF